MVAQLCAKDKTPFSVVLTTNFDDLVADAMFLYAESRPLVIHHEALAEYIRPTRSRPMVVKIHGNARLSPKNTALETEAIEEAMQEQVKKLLDDRGLLFFGYAGADESVLRMLNQLPPNTLKPGVYWVNKNPPSSKNFQKWLKDRKAVWVQHTDFDEAMLRFHRAYDLAPPAKDRFDTIFNTWERWFEELKERIDAKPDDDEDKARLTADTEAVRSSIDAWRSVNNILAMEKQDADAALSAYETAVREYPGFAPLLGKYANFLWRVRGDHDAAETFYKRAIEADPKHTSALNNYAFFLNDIRGEHDAAETFYKRAIEADPKHASILGNYAFFLADIRGDHDVAETFYKRAIEADPKHANILGNYANFLTDIRGDHDAAETFYKRAIEADPKHVNSLGNYANFLADIRGDHDVAEPSTNAPSRPTQSTPISSATMPSSLPMCAVSTMRPKPSTNAPSRLTQSMPISSATTPSFSLMYAETTMRPKPSTNAPLRPTQSTPILSVTTPTSSPMYAVTTMRPKPSINEPLRPTQSTPDILGNYAIFLINIRGDHNAAETFYKRAIKADPKHADILYNYAFFLTDIRGDHDAAETFYKRAIKADPKDAYALGNYGEFLLYRGERDRGFDLLDRSDEAARDKGDINKIAESEICRAIHTTGMHRRAALSRLHQSLRDIKAPYLLWWQGERQRRLSVATCRRSEVACKADRCV